VWAEQGRAKVMLSFYHLDCDGEYIHAWIFKEADAIT
jgi:hypothetical protein